MFRLTGGNIIALKNTDGKVMCAVTPLLVPQCLHAIYIYTHIHTHT